MKFAKSSEGICGTVQGRLDPYVSGELPDEENQQISRHVEGCVRCSEELRDRVRLKESLKSSVLSETVPGYLRARVVSRIRENDKESRRNPRRAWVSALAIAAALALAFLAGWVTERQAHAPGRLDLASREHYIDSVLSRVADIIRVGLGDHVHCAFFREFPESPPPAAEMVARLGPEYASLLPLVDERVADRYRVALAHQCTYRNRRFVHLALRGEGKLLSVVITRKQPAETFSRDNLVPVLQEAGVAVYQASAEDFEIAGLETREHLAFVVSDLSERENLQLAADIAAAVSELLGRVEGPA